MPDEKDEERVERQLGVMQGRVEDGLTRSKGSKQPDTAEKSPQVPDKPPRR